MKTPYTTLSESDFIEFVKKAHAGQTDLVGKPYFDHLKRVAERAQMKLQALPEGFLCPKDQSEAILLAYGHDLLEDTKVTTEELRDIGLSNSLIDRMQALSRIEPKSLYQDFIRSIAEGGDAVAIIVKLADNEDNNDPYRVNQLPVMKQTLTKRYDRAHFVLSTSLDKMLYEYQHKVHPR